MRYTDDPKPALTVSRRNLLTLLAKLDANREARRRVSACSIVDPDHMIMLCAEEDATHYDPVLRAALGHSAEPGQVVRDAESQRPIVRADLGAYINPDGSF